MKNAKGFFAGALFAAVCLLWAQPGLGQDVVDERIDQLNRTLKAQGLPWTAGRTSMSDLSLEQFRDMLGGPSEPSRDVAPTYHFLEEREDIPAGYTGGAPPASWDWRNKDGHNWMTPVTHQCCGDCWAHATCGSMEVRLRWQRGGAYGYELPINLAERYAVTCSPHGTCSSWSIPPLLDFIQGSGVADEGCLPYNCTSSCSNRCTNWNVRISKVTSHGIYSGPSDTYRTNVMNSCYNYGPIPVWMMVYSDFGDYSGGIYVKSPTATAVDGHFVNIVGWGTSGSTPYWICKNSWGTGWGVDGYFYIRRGTNESRIEEEAYWLTPQLLPNLDDYTPTGWDYPIVPRGDTSAAPGSVHLPTSLPGNGNTYFSVDWRNEGTVTARDHETHLTIDGAYVRWYSVGWLGGGSDAPFYNTGPHTVKGGRHTICFDEIDFDNRVWEYDEDDNWWCRQYIWSPYSLSNNTPVTRSSPPKKDSRGWVWYNSDGFSFLVQQVHPDAWWSAVGILPSNASADYDIRLHNIGTYTGPEGGFSDWLESSGYSGSQSDFVIVNDNRAAGGTYYASVINNFEGTGNYRIEEAASEKIYPRPGTQWNGVYSKAAENVLDIYEVYLNAGTYYFLLDQTAGTCDLGMTLYDQDTVTAKKLALINGVFTANSTSDGGDEAYQVTLSETGFYGLVVWKVDSSDYNKVHSYRIAVGPPAITVTAPNGGETLNIGNSYNLTWDSFGLASTIGSNVQIEISRDGGSTWSTIVGSTVNDGSHPWTAAGPLSAQCRIRVTSTSNGSYTDLSDANFTVADNTAPTPNPMTWATEPYELNTSQISMAASSASDPTGPVNYYFHFTSSPTGGTGGTDSVWQASSSYTDSGLGTNHQYGYQLKARDGSLNETAYSSISYDYTDIETPIDVTCGTATSSSIEARSSNTPSNLSSGSSGLYINNATKGTGSGWKQDNKFWESTGLTPNTSYSFQAVARNGDADMTPWSPPRLCYTLAKPPAAAAFTNITATSIQANWGANGNPAGTQFYCENTTKGTNSGWITATSWNSTGLSSSTPYSFRVKAKNGNGVETGWVNLGSATTLPPGDVCECDLVKDGKCNILDYQLFIQDWGRTNCGTPPGTGGPPNDCECDLNKDGKCNILDYQIFIQDWGRTDCP